MHGARNAHLVMPIKECAELQISFIAINNPHDEYILIHNYYLT